MYTPEQAKGYAKQLREIDCTHVKGWGVMADMLDAYAATLRQNPERGVTEATPNDDAGHELVRKHHLFVYEVDFGDEGKGRYVRLGDFNKVVAALEDALSAQQGQGEAWPAPPWLPIDQLPESDDLFWFLRGDTVDGPRPPQFGGYDADEWDYFAPCVEPPAECTAPPAQPAERVPEEITPEEVVAHSMGGCQWGLSGATTFAEGWNECRKAMLAASPAPSEGGKGVDGYVAFTCEEVREAYVCLRKHNCTIPDECLDQMRAVLLTAAKQAAR